MIGKLRHRIVFQERVESQDDAGGVTYTYTDAKTRWAKVEPLTSREVWLREQAEARATHRITIRWSAEIEAVAVATARIKWTVGSTVRYFEIEGPPRNIHERDRYLILDCVEVNDG